MGDERKAAEIGEALKKDILSRYDFEGAEKDSPTHNWRLRFHRKGQTVRVKTTEEALAQQSAEMIVKRLVREWQPPDEGHAAVCVYTDRIENVPFDPPR